MTCDEKYWFLLQEVTEAFDIESSEFPSPADIQVKYTCISIVTYTWRLKELILHEGERSTSP